MAQINKPTNYFNTITYTGTGATGNSQTVGFQPDFIWFKNRSLGDSHALFDSVRGRTKILLSDATNAELTGTTDLESFDANGFTVGAPDQVSSPNRSGSNIVSWSWLGGGTASSNTDGSITSSVSANTTSGFSIVSYDGAGATATVGHGLGVTPDAFIIKRRTGGTEDWYFYTQKIDGSLDFLKLNTTDAASNSAATAPTSTVFSVSSSAATGASGSTYIAYCFAEKKGFSKFGSYAGNSSTDGTFIYTGFKPALVIFKSTAGTESWSMVDNKRDTDNVVKNQLFPNLSIAEETTNNVMDFCSNGFKMRNADTRYNYSSYTYIYMAFAESPLVGTNNIPATAR